MMRSGITFLAKQGKHRCGGTPHIILAKPNIMPLRQIINRKRGKNLKDNKTKRVTFRVTEEEYKQLEELAYGSYRLVSVYCRDCVFGKKIAVIPGVDDAAKQLRHIGNNLNQLTWRVNEGRLTAVNLEETKRELAKIFELLNEKMKGA